MLKVLQNKCNEKQSIYHTNAERTTSDGNCESTRHKPDVNAFEIHCNMTRMYVLQIHFNFFRYIYIV